MRYLDANVIVDALVDQGTPSRARSVQLLHRLLEGSERLATTELVLAEVVFVLRTARAGRISREMIARLLKPLLSSPYLDMPNKALWGRALDIMATYRVDLPDAHLAATMEMTANAEVYSLDSDFEDIPGITRIQP